jgi:hypothetical protein
MYNSDDLFTIDPSDQSIIITKFPGEIRAVAGMSALGGYIFTAQKMIDKLEITIFNIADGTAKNVLTIPYSDIASGVLARAIKIRGISSGNMAISANNSIWMVELRQYVPAK